MLFNSLQFVIFFIIVFGLYLVLGHRGQNRMLLVASCIFYGAWDWRFLILMFISIGTDYVCGLKIYETQDRVLRKRWLLVSLIVNLAILGFFKYFNFFVGSLEFVLRRLGLEVFLPSLSIILPVGISFYTFQALSYTIDVYRGELVPTRSFPDYALFVTYFPQLVAGPIMRARDLLPQILQPRSVSWEAIGEGCYLIFWGLFQKVFVADNLAKHVDTIFAGPPYDGGQVLLALYAFAFQIYCDFAGYSNIARGLGRCMGFDIMVNFNLPYFATNPREFWQRWHISLSTWLRDYLYIPLGGNRGGPLLTYRNLMITMLLGGLWHGAAWTFVLWGAYHGTLLAVHRFLQPYLSEFPEPKSPLLSRAWFWLRVLFFFHLTCLGWLLFRARSLAQAGAMLSALLRDFSFSAAAGILVLKMVLYLGALLFIDLLQFRSGDPMAAYKLNPWPKGFLYATCFMLMILFGVTGGKEFIYFQF